MGGCAQVICKYYTILYEGLEHPRILVSAGVLETSPHGYRGMALPGSLLGVHAQGTRHSGKADSEMTTPKHNSKLYEKLFFKIIQIIFTCTIFIV